MADCRRGWQRRQRCGEHIFIAQPLSKDSLLPGDRQSERCSRLAASSHLTTCAQQQNQSTSTHNGGSHCRSTGKRRAARFPINARMGGAPDHTCRLIFGTAYRIVCPTRQSLCTEHHSRQRLFAPHLQAVDQGGSGRPGGRFWVPARLHQGAQARGPLRRDGLPHAVPHAVGVMHQRAAVVLQRRSRRNRAL